MDYRLDCEPGHIGMEGGAMGETASPVPPMPELVMRMGWVACACTKRWCLPETCGCWIASHQGQE